MDRIRLNRQLRDRLGSVASGDLWSRFSALNYFEGRDVRFVLIDPSENAASYRLRGEIVVSAGKRLFGYPEFVAALDSATARVRIGHLDFGN